MATRTILLFPGRTTTDFASCCVVLQQDSHAPASGVLVGRNLVLTAGHAAGPDTYVKVPASSMYAGTARNVRQVVPSPAGDLALLVLDECVDVEPCPLATPGDFDRALAIGVSLCGFGYTRDVMGQPVDWGYKRTIQPNLPVSHPLSIPEIESYSADTAFVVGGPVQLPDGTTLTYDAELGDSGSPAYLMDGRRIISVVGIDICQYAPDRNIYLRVDAASKWIGRVAAKYPPPPCPPSTDPVDR